MQECMNDRRRLEAARRTIEELESASVKAVADEGAGKCEVGHSATTPLPTTLSNATFAACTFFTSCTLIRKVPAFS